MSEVMMKTRECVHGGCSSEQSLNSFISEVFSAAIDTFRFTEAEKEKFLCKEVAQLITAIPFVAGCADAKRTALAHLAIYLTDLRGGDAIFEHSQEDNNSVYSRLRLISSFKDGDEKIIHHGMTLLALCMLDGYKRTEDKDAEIGAYNPLNDGSWNYDVLRTSLLNDIKQNPCKELDSLMNVGDVSPSPIWGD